MKISLAYMTYANLSHAQLTDWLQHTPKEVLAKNFQTDISDFDRIPAQELYIFPTGMCHTPVLLCHILKIISAPPDEDAKAVTSPQGTATNPYVLDQFCSSRCLRDNFRYTFALSKMPAKKTPGGSVKIVDSSTFKVSKTIAVAEVTIEPGHMRELHVSGIYLISPFVC
jgi:oxalate decarboxylase/phosphoglucose isomerase-like protein (cupin superfamily)